MALFNLSLLVVLSCGVLIVRGLALGLSYPMFPKWFSFGMDLCFVAAAALGFFALVGLIRDRQNRLMGWAVGLNVLTAAAVAWCTTVG